MQLQGKEGDTFILSLLSKTTTFHLQDSEDNWVWQAEMEPGQGKEVYGLQVGSNFSSSIVRQTFVNIIFYFKSISDLLFCASQRR